MNNGNDDSVKEEEKDEDNDDTAQKQDELEKLLIESENKYKRALADYQNLQRRVSQERSVWIQEANKDLLFRILTVFDTLVLAKKHISDEGLTVTLNQFLDVLKSEGVEPIKTLGQEFNPNLMEAVEEGKGQDGKVSEEIRTGFLIHGKLLRPALVKVGNAEKS